MARQKGMLNLSGNIEVNAGAPFDARDIVPTKADLTVASNFPYAYVGMETYVVAEDKKYRYMGGGVETLSNWVEVGSGGGTTYNDFVGATDLANGVHGLVPAPLIADKDKFLKGDGSWAEIAMPNVDLSNEISGYNIYSTTEKMIGQWIDGKPLYQKTVDFGALPNATTKNVSHNISDIDLIVKIDGIIFNKSTFNFFALLDDINPGLSIVNRFSATKTDLTFYTKDDRSNFKAYVTLYYTKTTDTAMPIGTPNDYSTTEKIVGTWIDGKPLYQKTILITLSNDGDNQINHNIENVDYIMVDLSHSYVIVGSETFPLTCVNRGSDATTWDVVFQWVNATKFDISVGSGRLGSGYITLQYTKTTD